MSTEPKKRALAPGGIRVNHVWRHYRLIRERNITLKETLLRRRRVVADDFWAVKDVSFEVAPGSAIGIVGVNGSGKSTLLKMIAGVLGPSSGTIETAGSVASLLDLGSGFSTEFTGRENAYMNAGLLGIRRRDVDDRIEEIIEFSELGDFIDQPVRTYSSGMMLRLAFSVAVMVEAEVILLDEVLAVGDEAFQRKCLGKMFERRRSGATIVFVSHDMGAVEMICDRAVLLEQGRLVADGIPADIIGQYHEDIAGHVEAPRAESAAIVVAEEDLASSAEIGETTPAARSWGTGRVRASGVRLTNEERVPTTRFLGGAQVQVEIDYEFADLDAPDPKFTVRVSELDGDVLFCVNTFIDEFDVQLQRPSGTVRLSIPDLPLMQGRFLLSIGLSTKEESEIFHLLERWVEFSVFSPRRQDGIIDVRRSWSTV